MDKIDGLFQSFEGALKETLRKLKVDEAIEFDIMIPEDRSHGDIATNAALKLSPYFKKSPMALAGALAKGLDKEALGINRIDSVKPGFINFYLKDQWVIDIGNMVLENGIRIVREKEKKILEIKERVTTDPFHTLRIKSYRDIMVRVMSLVGYTITEDNGYHHDLVLLITPKEGNLHKGHEGEEGIVVGGFQLKNSGKIPPGEPHKILSKELAKVWAISKTYKSDVEIPSEIIHLNHLDNPYFYITYPYLRCKNLVLRLEKEGYQTQSIRKMDKLPLSEEGRSIIIEILRLDTVLDEVISFREPYKLYHYIYNLSTKFYGYHTNLFLREKSKDEIEINLFLLKVMERYFLDILKLIGLNF